MLLLPLQLRVEGVREELQQEGGTVVAREAFEEKSLRAPLAVEESFNDLASEEVLSSCASSFLLFFL